MVTHFDYVRPRKIDGRRQDAAKLIHKTKLAIIIMLLIYLIFGIEEIYRKEGRNFDNPYLEVSEFRFIWAVLIPVIWILVFLFSPNIKKFCKKKSIEFD